MFAGVWGAWTHGDIPKAICHLGGQCDVHVMNIRFISTELIWKHWINKYYTYIAMSIWIWFIVQPWFTDILGCTFLISSMISSLLLSLGMQPRKRRQLLRVAHTPRNFPGRTSYLFSIWIAMRASSLEHNHHSHNYHPPQYVNFPQVGALHQDIKF